MQMPPAPVPIEVVPYAFNKKARIYWESHGTGEPILLIMGLSFTLDMWHRVLPWLTTQHQTILFDNRGVGRSSLPRGPYKMTAMMRDALAVMDAAGIERAHIMGASMGGMIAQELALRHPARVKSLLLGCTSCGGLQAKMPNLSRFPVFRRWGSMNTEERARAVIPLLYAETTPADRIEEDIAIRLQNYPPSKGILNQAMAIPFWKSYRRLPRLRIPTFILHGDQDRVLPPENARRIAKRIKGSELVIVPGAGHMMITDQPDICRDAILNFLARQY